MRNDKILIKSPKDLDIMSEGGKKLKFVKDNLKKAVYEGVNAKEIDDLAEDLILRQGAKPSFKMVPGYFWTTCVNTNDGVVHGIPKEEVVFKKGDIISVDVGLFYKGFHTDTSFTVGISAAGELESFLDVGRNALKKAISEAKAGKRIYDISRSIEEIVKGAGFSPIRALVGHGVGRALHENPQIPCFIQGAYEDSPIIAVGAVLAIEVMYTKGGSEIKLEKDGWTISSSDGTISALFEDTVAVTEKGPEILTD